MPGLCGSISRHSLIFSSTTTRSFFSFSKSSCSALFPSSWATGWLKVAGSVAAGGVNTGTLEPASGKVTPLTRRLVYVSWKSGSVSRFAANSSPHDWMSLRASSRISQPRLPSVSDTMSPMNSFDAMAACMAWLPFLIVASVSCKARLMTLGLSVLIFRRRHFTAIEGPAGSLSIISQISRFAPQSTPRSIGSTAVSIAAPSGPPSPSPPKNMAR
mmetsp:Transcript_8194/g.17370  ORF Transcript_8194/g.17370 Transcript_8194/m.17370 type:complete len:215 (+) Transcript_8194:805-1449(+)